MTLLTTQQKEQLLNLYTHTDMSVAEIAKQFGVSAATVTNVRNRAGVSGRRTTTSFELESKVVELYQQLQTVKAVSDKLGIGRNFIAKILLKHGFSDLHALQSQTKRLVQSNPFLDLNEDTVQYFLGLLATDGCVHTTKALSLGLTDLNIMKAYCSFLGVPDSKLHTYKDPRSPKSKPIYSLKFTNPEIVSTLNAYGLVERKSTNLQMRIPITYPFLRGVIDGDGTVRQESENSICIVICNGSLPFIQQLQDFLTQEGMKTSIYPTGKVHMLRIGRKQQLNALYIQLYARATVYIERKRCMFDLIR